MSKVRKFRTQREFLLYLNALLPSNSTITALAPDKGDDFRPYQLSTPLKGAEIKRFRELFLTKLGGQHPGIGSASKADFTDEVMREEEKK